MTVEIAQDEPHKRLAGEVGLQVGRLLVETQGWKGSDAFTTGVTVATYGAEMAMEVMRRNGQIFDDPRDEEVDSALDEIADDLGIKHRAKSTVVTPDGDEGPKGLPIIG